VAAKLALFPSEGIEANSQNAIVVIGRRKSGRRAFAFLRPMRDARNTSNNSLAYGSHATDIQRPPDDVNKDECDRKKGKSRSMVNEGENHEVNKVNGE
jgi:hypothetical protein